MAKYGTNNIEIRVLALRRSGHHGVTNWICHQFDKNSVFWFNDIPPKEIGKKTIYTKRNLQRYGKYRKRFNKTSSKKPYFVETKIKANKIPFQNKKCLLHSYEDKYLNIISLLDKQNNGKTKKMFNVIILRDPFNMTASRIYKKKGTWGLAALPFWGMKNEPKPIKNINKSGKVARCPFRYKEILKQYMKFYLNEKLYPTNATNIFIKYNQWFQDKSYREKISKQIGIKFSDNGLNQILQVGGGSSFQTVKKGQKLNPLKRWRQVANRKAFKFIAQDEEIKNLSNQIFGPILD